MNPKLRELIAGLAVIAGGLWLMLGVCGYERAPNGEAASRLYESKYLPPEPQWRAREIHEGQSIGCWFHVGENYIVNDKPGWMAGAFALPYAIEAYGTPYSIVQVDFVREHWDDHYHKDFLWSWPPRQIESVEP